MDLCLLKAAKVEPERRRPAWDKKMENSTEHSTRKVAEHESGVI